MWGHGQSMPKSINPDPNTQSYDHFLTELGATVSSFQDPGMNSYGFVSPTHNPLAFKGSGHQH
jgi:hypothetical protein